MRRSLLVLILSIGLLDTTAAAQNQPPRLQQEIVVTASSVAEELESTPASVTIVTREAIEERHARDVADVLREIPGLTISRTGSSGKATSLFTRGSNSTHTLVLWNGIEINNPYFSGYDWGRFSTAGVERIEIVRGPYSALYGSDAVAGVINILTAARTTGGAIEVLAGGRGLRGATAVGTAGAGPLRLSAMIDHRDDDGWAANDDFGQTAAHASLDWRASSSFSAGLHARYTSYDLGIPFNTSASGTELVPSLHRRQEGSEHQLSLPVRHTMGDLTWSVILSESKRDDDFSDPEDPFGLTFASTESTTRRAQTTALLQTRSLGTLVGGAEYERARVDDVSSFGPSLEAETRTNRAVFVEQRLSRSLAGPGRLEISAGARYDHFDTFGSQLSPRLAAAWIIGSTKWRVGGGEAFRAPSVGELYFPFFGNRELLPESSTSWEAGFDRFLRDGQLSITLFHNDFDDLIVFDNQTFTFSNIGRATTKGIELGLQRRFANGFATNLSYTYLDTEQEETGESLLRRPRNSGSLSVAWSRGPIRTSAVILHSGERADILPVFPFSRVTGDAHTTADLVISWSARSFEPYAKIENITSEEYEEVLGFRSPGRRMVVGLRYNHR